MSLMQVHRTELIVGGQKSGKSKRAEQIVRGWLNASTTHQAVLIATAQVFDSEMQARVDHHQDIRAKTIPEIQTIEEPLHIGEIVSKYVEPHQMIVIDCLTVWLTNLLMPHPELAKTQKIDPQQELNAFIQSLENARGPVILVSNEIGLGVIPMGRETRQFVDELGRLNQRVATVCQAVTLMVAGIAVPVKRPS